MNDDVSAPTAPLRAYCYTKRGARDRSRLPSEGASHEPDEPRRERHAVRAVRGGVRVLEGLQQGVGNVDGVFRHQASASALREARSPPNEPAKLRPALRRG